MSHDELVRVVEGILAASVVGVLIHPRLGFALIVFAGLCAWYRS